MKEKSTLASAFGVVFIVIAGVSAFLLWWDSANYPLPQSHIGTKDPIGDPFADKGRFLEWVSTNQEKLRSAREDRIRKRIFSNIQLEGTSWDFVIRLYPYLGRDRSGMISFSSDQKVHVTGEAFIEGVSNESFINYRRINFETIRLFGSDGNKWNAQLLYEIDGNLTGTTYEHPPYEARFELKKRQESAR